MFLPTAERCSYPLLINGAFASDLSRQEIRVSPAADDYNTWLIGEAARVFRDGLLPALRNEDQSPAQILGLLDRSAGAGGDTSAALHRAMAKALAHEPLIPAGETLIALAETVVPPIVGGTLGDDIRRLLPDDVTVDGRRLPSTGHPVWTSESDVDGERCGDSALPSGRASSSEYHLVPRRRPAELA